MRRRRGMLAGAGALFIVGPVILIVGPLAWTIAPEFVSELFPEYLVVFAVLFCGAVALTLLAVELIWTALTPNGHQAAPPPNRSPEPR